MSEGITDFIIINWACMYMSLHKYAACYKVPDHLQVKAHLWLLHMCVETWNFDLCFSGYS